MSYFVTRHLQSQYKSSSSSSSFSASTINAFLELLCFNLSYLPLLEGQQMEMKQLLQLLALLLFFLINSNTVLAQSPAPAPTLTLPPAPPALVPAPAPGPPPPTNITAILEKAGGFSTLIRLLITTQTADRINTQLNKSSQGLTIFAPTDAAFANLHLITLNSLTNQQQSELVQFHMLPSFYSIPQFQTASDPLSTEAGGANYGEFPLNITTSASSVNISTGFSNASIQSTVYTDNQLAVYEVNRVLLPQRFFIAPPPVPAPAPVPPKPKKNAPSKSDETAQANSSDTVCVICKMFQASYAILVLQYILCM